MATWPDILAVKQWARIPDGIDDAAIDASLNAVKAAIVSRCPMLDVVEPGLLPDDVHVASLMWTTRLLNRRNSPEGIVGTEFGAVNVGRYDTDIGRLLSPHVAPVLA